MKIWQADFYRRPLQAEAGSPLWELLICDAEGRQILSAFCPQREANSLWLTQQIQKIGDLPDRLQVFRPQSLSLLQAAYQPLEITVEPTRSTPALKQLLQAKYGAIELEKLPPVPLPETSGENSGALGGSPLKIWLLFLAIALFQCEKCQKAYCLSTSIFLLRLQFLA